MKKAQTAALASLLKSIAHPFRLEILCLLQNGEMTVGEISKAVQTSDANVSQHLAILRNQGIVATRREANFIYNRIADDRVTGLIETMQGLFCTVEE
jgi:ArsR family transcriptional regulator